MDLPLADPVDLREVTTVQEAFLRLATANKAKFITPWRLNILNITGIEGQKIIADVKSKGQSLFIPSSLNFQ